MVREEEEEVVVGTGVACATVSAAGVGAGVGVMLAAYFMKDTHHEDPPPWRFGSVFL